MEWISNTPQPEAETKTDMEREGGWVERERERQREGVREGETLRHVGPSVCMCAKPPLHLVAIITMSLYL